MESREGAIAQEAVGGSGDNYTPEHSVQRFLDGEAKDDKIHNLKFTLLRFQLAYTSLKANIASEYGGIADFAEGWRKFGLKRASKGFFFAEWAPAAVACFLTGDFNGWNKSACPCSRDENGVWRCFIPDVAVGKPAIPHKSAYKIILHILDPSTGKVEEVYRVPAWATSVKKSTHVYNAIYRDPSFDYHWINERPPRPNALLIYEAHVGMAGEEPRVHSYSEFRKMNLPHIKRLGYNAVQLMGIMEHSYYASYGYQITNFFAASSHFGSLNKFKQLIDAAHGMGMLVILDLVHSHASSNVDDGLNLFDGSKGHYFHSGDRGIHPDWKTRLFDYGKKEVQQLLLSNLRWWVEEYRIDGFRFDAVTSMLYKNHGHQEWNNYPECYFSDNLDLDALNYLKLANEMLHNLYPNIITIAEEVSGIPGLCRRVEDSGIGFDYRMALGIPNLWSYLLSSDEDWSMRSIVAELTKRRKMDSTVAYVECHDQSIQGGRTVAHYLFNEHTHGKEGIGGPMDIQTIPSVYIQRAMELHKMIRLITFGMAGDAYLNFMGNEYGHPFWVDFPCARNHESYEHARRLWSLCRDSTLRHSQLGEFDAAMLAIQEKYNFLNKPTEILIEEGNKKVIIFQRSDLIWVFNWHPSHIAKCSCQVPVPGRYAVILDTDATFFGGEGRKQQDELSLSTCGQTNKLPVPPLYNRLSTRTG